MQNFVPEFVHEDTSYRFGMHIGYSKDKIVDIFSHCYNNTPLRGFQVMPSRSYKAGLSQKKVIENWQEAGYNNKRRNKFCYIHAPYIINLAGAADPKNPKFHEMLEKSREGLKSFLDMGALMNAKVVVHIGSCKDRKKGIETIVRSINECILTEGDKTAELTKKYKVPIMDRRRLVLENGAGQGSYIGCTIDEMTKIYTALKPEVQEKVAFCIDTAHLQGEGEFDMGSIDDIDRFYQEFDENIGLDHLDCFHFNDSEVELGAKKDAHAWIGLGKIFDSQEEEKLEGLRHFVEKAKEERLPMICEYGGNATAWNYTWSVLCALCNIESCYCCSNDSTSNSEKKLKIRLV